MTAPHRLWFGFALGLVGFLVLPSGSPLVAQGYGWQTRADQTGAVQVQDAYAPRGGLRADGSPGRLPPPVVSGRATPDNHGAPEADSAAGVVGGYGVVDHTARPADFHPMPEPVVSPWEMPPGTAIWALPAQSPHRVVRQPPLLSHEELKRQAHRDKFGPPVATIPKAAVSPVWKQPYAYGYFGAQPSRQWQRHFGWNRSYTQWTLK